jgi:hypothetical protein
MALPPGSQSDSSRCRGIADPSLGWQRMTAGDAFQQQTCVIKQSCLRGAVQIELLQHVLLGVAAAQTIHAAKRGTA